MCKGYIKTHINKTFPLISFLGDKIKSLYKIEVTTETDIVFSKSIIDFFKENELEDCLFYNDEDEIGMIAIDVIVLEELKKMVEWDLEPKDSTLTKFKNQIEKDLENRTLIHYRVY